MGSKSKKSHKKSSSSSSKKEKKKSSHKSHESRKKSGDPLADALTFALVECPNLMEELPEIVAAMDKGEYVNLECISNVPMRDALISVFREVPVVTGTEGEGWHRNSRDQRVADFLLAHLLACGAIVEPKKLSSSEQLSSRSAPLQLMRLLRDFPQLRDELPALFDQVLDGSAVQLDSLDNEDLAEGVEKLLKALGLVHSSDGLDVPENKRESEQVIDCLEHFEEIFKATRREKSRKEPAAKQRDGSSDSESDKSTSSTDSESERETTRHDRQESESEDEGLPGPAMRVVGPYAPSLREREKAQLLMSQYVQRGEDDVSSDDEHGPRIDTNIGIELEKERRNLESAPLGFMGVDVHSEQDRERAILAEQAAEAAAITAANKREDWILTPGDSKTLAELSANPLNIVSRKFQTGKQAKKKAEDLQIRNAYIRSLQGQGEVQEETVEEQRASLMEEHLAKRVRTEMPAPSGRRAFDREKDMLEGKKLQPQDVQRLVENSKELSSRFSKGATQKKFV